MSEPQEIDITEVCKSKTDQINAVDLHGKPPLVVQIKGVKVAKGEEQPVTMHLHNSLPFRPCLTMRRLMKEVWGKNAAEWVGRWLTLYTDPGVTFGKVRTGGIRISHMSDISGQKTVTLPTSRGKFETYTVQPMRPPTQEQPRQDRKQADRPTADLTAVLADAELTEADVDRWLETKGRPSITTQADEKRAEFAGYLAGHPEALDAIRALVESAPDTDTTADEGEE